MKRSALRPGKKCPACNGKGCLSCKGRGFLIKPPKAKPPIKPRKDGRSSLDVQYSALRREFLLAHPRCEVLQPHGGICGAPATECHHRRGRGRFLLDEATFLACCRECHSRIHGDLARWSHTMGYLISVASTKPTERPSQTFIPYDAANREA